MSSEDFGFKEISKIVDQITSYKPAHIENQLFSLDSRLDLINQTVNREGHSIEKIRVDKINKQIVALKDKYYSISSNSPLEDKANIMGLVNDINKQIETLEGKSGENNGD